MNYKHVFKKTNKQKALYFLELKTWDNFYSTIKVPFWSLDTVYGRPKPFMSCISYLSHDGKHN